MIEKIWSPYVSGKLALLSLDTFSAHFTDRVRGAFANCNTKLLLMPGGCTSVLQPPDISINKPFKSYIRQMWCQRMVDEAEKGVHPKITPASKSLLLELIKTAIDLVEKKPNTVKNSFEVAGIIDRGDLRKIRRTLEINDVLADVFGEEHMGYVRPSDDPFVNCSEDSDTNEDSFANCSDNSDSEKDETCSDEDPFGDESSCDVSAGDFSDLSDVEN